jgi:hypothetical protein
MMECTEVRGRLERYLDNDLPASLRQAMDAHLAHCYLCQEELNGIVTVLDLCRDVLRHPDPQPRFEALVPTLKRAQTAPEAPGYKPVHRFRRFAVAALAAAAILLLVSLGRPLVHTARVLAVLADGEEGEAATFGSMRSDFGEAPNRLNLKPLHSCSVIPLLLAWQQEIQQAQMQTIAPVAASAPVKVNPPAQVAPGIRMDVYEPVSRNEPVPTSTEGAGAEARHEPTHDTLWRERSPALQDGFRC